MTLGQVEVFSPSGGILKPHIIAPAAVAPRKEHDIMKWGVRRVTIILYFEARGTIRGSQS